MMRARSKNTEAAAPVCWHQKTYQFHSSLSQESAALKNLKKHPAGQHSFDMTCQVGTSFYMNLCFLARVNELRTARITSEL